jgi:hypothetical protein
MHINRLPSVKKLVTVRAIQIQERPSGSVLLSELGERHRHEFEWEREAL